MEGATTVHLRFLHPSSPGEPPSVEDSRNGSLSSTSRVPRLSLADHQFLILAPRTQAKHVLQLWVNHHL